MINLEQIIKSLATAFDDKTEGARLLQSAPDWLSNIPLQNPHALAGERCSSGEPKG